MKNFEFYADEIKKIGLHRMAIDAETKKPCKCTELFCGNCLMNTRKLEETCYDALWNWFLQEAEIDWSKVPVDTPIYVSMDEKDWVPRYFAAHRNDRVYAWSNGGTSFSARKDACKGWPYARLASKEEENHDEF